jgi:putative DNA primase/helicase
LTRSEPGIRCRFSAFDSDPFIFNVQNGSIDLRSGGLRKHSRDDLISEMSQIDYDSDATCPKWDEFLLQIMDGDRHMVEYLQRAVGYSLTGSTAKQCFFLHARVGR